LITTQFFEKNLHRQLV